MKRGMELVNTKEDGLEIERFPNRDDYTIEQQNNFEREARQISTRVSGVTLITEAELKKFEDRHAAQPQQDDNDDGVVDLGISLGGAGTSTGGEKDKDKVASKMVLAERTELKKFSSLRLIPIPDHVETNPDLKTNVKVGLTAQEAADRLVRYGHNEIIEKKKNPCLKFLGYFTDSIAILVEIAIIFSGILEDWTDFGIITALLFVNALIGFLQERSAENAIEALKNTLASRRVSCVTAN